MLAKYLPLLRRHGWRKVKLYFMIGFPWESDEDLLAIRDLITPFVRHRMEVNLSVSPFTPKPHTPFQWLPVDDEDRLREKAILVRKAASLKGVKVKVRDIRTSLVEALIARGDGRLSSLFESLHAQGVKLEAWTESFNPALYDEWLAGRDGLAREILGPRERGGELPWGFVDTGVEDAFLQEELEKAEAGEITESCYASCAGCGLSCAGGRACLAREDSAVFGASALPAVDTNGAYAPEPEFTAITLRYAKQGETRYIGHLDTIDLLLRAVRSAGVSLRMHGKYHPKPRVSLSPALPVGIESTCEMMEIEAEGMDLPDPGLAARINARLPRGMRVLAATPGRMDASRRFGYILLGAPGLAGEEVEKIADRQGKSFYRSSSTHIKDLWLSGNFRRIVKVEDRRIDGIRADY
jgi:hypothetical protein